MSQIRSAISRFANRLSIFAFVALATASIASGSVVYDEDVDGDLSSDNTAPTLIAMSAGSNEIFATLNEGGSFDRDFFTIVIGANQTLDEIVMTEYSTGNASFFAVEAGPQITNLGSGAGLLGASLIGGGDLGTDVLDDLAGASQAGSGFTPPLGPGTYTFWFQETSQDEIDYSFDYRISQVPEPTSGAVCLIALAGFAIRRRRS